MSSWIQKLPQVHVSPSYFWRKCVAAVFEIKMIHVTGPWDLITGVSVSFLVSKNGGYDDALYGVWLGLNEMMFIKLVLSTWHAEGA